MIGALVYKLRAENETSLPFVNGRLMHAAFFKILNDFSPTFGTFIHNEWNIKPFTVSFLEPTGNILSFGDRWAVHRGDKFIWRVTGLNEKVLQAALNFPVGEKIRAGSLSLRLEKIICDKKIRSDTGVVEVEDFISDVKNFHRVDEISFDFVSPVSFRIDDFDAPYPRAELIFSSLADKWTQAQMPVAADKKIIREFAENVRLTQWRGESQKFFLSQNRGTLAFSGQFSYSLENLSVDVQKVFLLLAKFGEFAGVGRLTGQGFGQTRISFAAQKN